MALNLQASVGLVISLLLLADLSLTLLTLLQFYSIGMEAVLVIVLVLPLALIIPSAAGLNALFSHGSRRSAGLARVYALWNVTSIVNTVSSSFISSSWEICFCKLVSALVFSDIHKNLSQLADATYPRFHPHTSLQCLTKSYNSYKQIRCRTKELSSHSVGLLLGSLGVGPLWFPFGCFLYKIHNPFLLLMHAWRYYCLNMREEQHILVVESQTHFSNSWHAEWLWISMKQCRMLFLKTSTLLPPSIAPKTYWTWKVLCCKTTNFQPKVMASFQCNEKSLETPMHFSHMYICSCVEPNSRIPYVCWTWSRENISMLQFLTETLWFSHSWWH